MKFLKQENNELNILNDRLIKEKQKKEEEINEYQNKLNKYQNELDIVSNAQSQKMIELSNELEQKKLKKEKRELEQKINIVESQKTSINNEHSRLVKYYKEYKDLHKYIGPEEYKKYKNLKKKKKKKKK